MQVKTLAFCLALLATAAFAAPRMQQTVSHEGDVYARIHNPSDAVRQLVLDGMDLLGQTATTMDVRLTKYEQEILSVAGVEFEIVFSDIQKLIDEEVARENNPKPNADWFDDYHRYEEIKQWYIDLVANAPAGVNATFIPRIGVSHEGRDIFAITVTRGSDAKDAIYFQALQHAREWISGAVIQYISDHLINGNTGDLLERLEYVIVPVVNPDGYEYSWTNDRMWRKNRRNNSGSSAYGVDLNRNWDIMWGQGGSSSNPASDTYMGPAPASEPETQAAVSAFLSNNHRVIAAIDWHAYSQLILRPYGYQRGDAMHESELFECAAIMQEQIRNVHGKHFQNIHSIELYLTTGTASDYFYSKDAYDVYGVWPYGYTMELRPSSAWPGFQLPPEEIIPSGEEQIPAVEAFSRYVLDHILH
eukprot:NODE_600_length_1336_cov_406.497105_g561_i0.p1 GENE.NODE_600_length_1336_cov_406.497105_g561_i0~~NODE_600_length_1336_cov_406.497105_g561_i0.p1  ORF type:complete len:432 (-),score=138.65 NODE_600_length_1336_cov_406.497105_g561_i0:41-1291(-)